MANKCICGDCGNYEQVITITNKDETKKKTLHLGYCYECSVQIDEMISVGWINGRRQE